MFKTSLILTRIQPDIVTNLHRSSSKVFIILGRFSKNTELTNLMKIVSVRTELFHAGRQTDRDRQT